MYRKQSRVSFSQVGEDGRMTPLSIIDAMQDCSCEHSDSLGRGRDYLAARHGAWLLNTWQILFDRFPGECESYTMETRPWQFKRFFGSRNFAMIDEAGEYMVRANSLWFYVDTDRMRPAVPDPDIIAVYGVDEPLEMPYWESRKLKLPEVMTEKDSFPVLRAHLDTNHHVNNAQYVMMACEYLPENYEIAEIRAEYRTAAKYGERIYPAVGVDENGWTVIALRHEDGSIYVIVAVRPR